jgi:uroporphyrinogen decarboxylase
MNPKENAQRIIHFDHPERIVEGPPGHGIGYHGVNHEGYSGGGHHLPVGSFWTDIWGTGWQLEQEGVMGFPRVHPLSDLPHALKTYQWPNPDDERICSKIYETARGWDKQQTFLMGSHRDTLWEKAYMLVGMEALMIFMKTEPEAVQELLLRIMDFQLGIAHHYLNVGIEIAACGDDLGTQSGLLLSPKIIHTYFLPQYHRLFSLYKQKQVLIDFHSCGHILPLLEMFIDLGIDILNPIQATANDLTEVRRITQGRMCLQGGVSSALIVSGPVEAIQEEAVFRMAQLGQEGGYFCTVDQGMPWPREHRDALALAVAEHGTYPL